MQHHIFLIAFFLILALVVPGIIAMRMLSTVFFADTRHPPENPAAVSEDAESLQVEKHAEK